MSLKPGVAGRRSHRKPGTLSGPAAANQWRHGFYRHPVFHGESATLLRAWNTQGTFDYMPSQFVTFRIEFTHRATNVPYFSGTGGVTPPGGNNGNPAVIVPGWFPDLRKKRESLDFRFACKALATPVETHGKLQARIHKDAKGIRIVHP